jgi:hypothetical protein
MLPYTSTKIQLNDIPAMESIKKVMDPSGVDSDIIE